MHSGETDQTHQIKLPSAIERVQWADLRAAPGGTVGLEVSTRYVGNGSTLQIKLTDHQGTTHGTFKNQIHNNHLSAEVQVPPKAKDALYAEVKLPKHGLMQKSPALLLTGPVNITNAEWSKDEARRGDVLTLSADVKGVPDGTEARVQIFEHDEESAHDPVTELSALVEKKKVEVEWEYEYHEDTDRIPTEEEAAKGYRPPEYFFRVEMEGVEAKSGLLTFKDQLSLQLIDAVEQVAYALQDYLINLPDGTEETGTLDEKGRLQIDEALPGPHEVIFPDLYDKEPQGEQVEDSSGEDDVIDSDAAPDGKAKAGVQSGSQHRVEHRRGSFKSDTTSFPCELSASELVDGNYLFDQASDDAKSTFIETLEEHGGDYGLDSKEDVKHFIAQTAHESGGKITAVETAGAATSNISREDIEDSRYTGPDAKYSVEEVMGNQKLMVNIDRADRYGNGPPSSGDGWTYRGRGPIQLTWKGAYRNFTNHYQDQGFGNTDFVDNPERLSNDARIGTLAALWYWENRVLPDVDGNLTVKKLTLAINNGTTGLQDRKNQFEAAKDAINCDS